ncbi:lipase/acyltransferase domain-containing protein [Methylobacterium nigriterrae]|uniref:lipase/acyltransferase domain-containing protein n=1 Tax=Methylobacterium nigriterrae TaxID=3127512 RepID=UPI003013E26C
MRARFDDLWYYHSETGFAQEVRERLIERFKAASGQCVLIFAHSMGTIIAYDALRMLERNTPSTHIDSFLTLGSSLGLADVKLKITEEHGSVRVPKNVGHWTNLVDARDVAAVTGALADDYAPHNGTSIHDVEVLNEYRRPNGEANHHKSNGYPRTPELSAIAPGFTALRPSGT